MDETLRVQPESHENIQKLLPWYVIGALGTEEAAQIEAHLAGCVECRADVQSERALGDRVAALPIDVARGWAALRQRIQAPLDGDARNMTGPTTRRGMARPRIIGWLLSAQAAAILVLSLALAIPQFDRTTQYRALGAAPSDVGNMIVVFRPETPERELRRILNASGARLVDGPTSANAYVLQVADAERGAALAKLRAQGDVVLAEPIDASGQP